MLKRIKRRVERVKDELRRRTESPERTTPATQRAAASNPAPDPASPHPPGLTYPDTLGHSIHPDSGPIGSTSPNQRPSGASPGSKPDPVSGAPLEVIPESISPGMETQNVQQQDPAQAASSTFLGGERGVKDAGWFGLKALIDVLDGCAETFGPLKSAVGGLSRLIEVYESRIGARKGYVQLRADLNGLCQDISRYLGGAAPPSMTPSISILARGIEEEVNLISHRLGRSAVESYAKATEDSDEILGCYRRVQALLNRLSLNANMDIWKIVDEEATRSRLKDLPNSPAARYSSAHSDSLGRNQCTPNTRVDVLEQMHRWAHDTTSKKIYWLNGMAGTGKTTITYTLCERLQAEGRLAASFFCSRQVPTCREVGRILPSVAYQLSLFSRPFRYALSNALELDPEVYNQPVHRQFGSLLIAPLLKAEKSLPADLVIVIDALDECEDADSVGRMLSAMLADAAQLPIKLFLTSRPNPKILKQMESEQGGRVRSELHLHELDRSIVQSDIRTYLSLELEELKLESSDLEALVERSGVLFIYASTVIRYVKHDDLSRSSRRLKLILSKSAASNSSHEGIDELYDTILEAALSGKGLDFAEREEMEQVLRTVVCAQEPLSVDAIAGLLGLNDVDSIRTAIRPLLSVLQVSSKSGLVTTLHESFPDYLFDVNRSKRFYCDAKRHHARLARACFDQIETLSPPFNVCNLESSYVPDIEVHDLDGRIRSAVSQHLFYACQYWEAHAELMGVSDPGEDRLFQFLSGRLLLWMEIMNLKQVIRTAIGMLSRLDMWLPRGVSSSTTRELALDALKFITAYASSPTQRLTPHIYLSTLALWPTERAVSRYYSASLSGLTPATGTAVNRRETAMLAKWDASAKVYSVACSPDGARIASGGDDHAIQIWDARTGDTVGLPLQGHTGVVWSITYSPSGAQIVSGSEDCTICIWDAHTRQMIGSPLEGHASAIFSVAYLPDGMYIVSGSRDKTIRIWDAHTGRMLGEPTTGHTDEVNSVAYSPDGKWIVSGSDDWTVRIWDVRTRQMLGNPLEGHTGRVWSVAFSPDGHYIVSGSGDNTIRVWDAHAGQMLGQPITGHTNSVRSVAYSPNGDYIIPGSYDGTICIWDSHTRKMVGQPLKGHSGLVQSVRYSSDGTRIISGSNDRTIRIWDAHAGQTLGQATEGHTDSVRCVAYSPNSMHIVSGSEDKTICIWDAHTGQMVGQPLECHEGAVYSVAYSPDGKHAVSGSEDRTIRIWDVNSGKPVGEPLEGHTANVWSVAYSPDGARIASGSWDETIRIWDAHTGQMMGQPLKGHGNYVFSVAYSPDGMRIVSGSADDTIRIWDAQTGQIFGQPMIVHTNDINSVSYSPDGKHIVSGCDDCTVRIWDAQTGEILGQPLEGHTDWVLSVAYSPDGKYIVSASVDNTIRIWDARTGKTLGQPREGHTTFVYSVAYSPDGTRIVSGSYDGTIRIWDATTLQRLGDLSQSHQDSNRQDPQAPDSSILVSSGSSPDLRVYEPKTAGGCPILPSSDPNAWTLSRDGWVVSYDLKPLIWVPPELRNTLLRYGNTCLISKEGSWKIDISKAKFGKDWKECYRPSNV